MTYTRNRPSNGYSSNGNQQDEPSQMIRVSGLWRGKTRAGQPMLSGSVGGLKIIVLQNQQVEGNGPTHSLFIAPAKPKDGQQGQRQQPADDF